MFNIVVLFQCFVFDKFEGFKSEYELTSRALQLIGQNKYFGGKFINR